VWFLTAEGDTAQHVYEVIAAGATDHEVMQHAIDRGAVIITADTDFRGIASAGREDGAVGDSHARASILAGCEPRPIACRRP
jgi:hypothetical protein